MFTVKHTETINVPKQVVWDVICNTKDYPLWNKFVVACDSTFEEGSPIKMKVKVFLFMAMPQKETIFKNKKGEFLEYGIKIPFGTLSSSRQHILTAVDENTTQYESVFILKGWFSSVVGFLLGSQLRRGFSDMTQGIVGRSLEVNNK